MIPGLLANEVSAALREFIVTGFETETTPFKGEFRRLVEEQQDGEAFIKGPYVSIGLPFQGGTSGKDFFKGFETEHPPYAHQEQSWQRLASNLQSANTLVATGTGSGKTECFLYPILDHCQREGAAGIKAIIIYPMNALASDQAKRFAEIINSQSPLKGLRVGLFVGGDALGSKVMGPKQVITDKDELRNNPPDVLLTNYKMLDYLLMRPKDQKLWLHNGPETLRYLVVDELHTFDGAQGTDLSLLLRRLRARFKFHNNKLICVGTSATLGGEDSTDSLLGYATDIFSSRFTRDSVVVEQRQTEAEFLDDIHYLNLNSEIDPNALKDALNDSLEAYLSASHQLYFSESPPENLMDKPARVTLGKKLRQHGQVANLLRKLMQGHQTPTFQTLVKRLAAQIPSQFQRQPEQALIALLALMAHARSENGLPFVQLRLQLWSRELRRIVAALRDSQSPETEHHEDDYVADETLEPLPPLLSFGDDKPPKNQSLIRLPLVQCTECHGTAWLTRMESSSPTDQKIETDLNEIYPAFFANHEETSILMPWNGKQKTNAGSVKFQDFRVCKQCGQTARFDYHGDCKACQADNDDLVRVSKPNQLKETRQNNVNRTIHDHDCPYCHSESSLMVFGARAASLSAVAIHQLFSSRDNDDRKLLTFSDSVQDATHRAGFFAARTWKNNIRMGLTQLLNQHDKPLPILELPEKFETYWLNHGENQGRLDLASYMREFMPPDKRFRADFEAFEQFGEVENPKPLLSLIKRRALWEALEDTSWRSLIGRSLNRVGVAALDWPGELVDKAVSIWQPLAFNELGYEITTERAYYFLNGLMQHLVNLGAIGLDDLKTYRQQRGKAYLLNIISYAPSYGPSSSRPKYPAQLKGEAYQQVFLPTQSTWFLRWLTCVNPETLAEKQQLELVLYKALDVLAEVGLANAEKNEKGLNLWSLSAEKLSFSTNLAVVECRGYRPMFVAAEKADKWLGSPALSASSDQLLYEKVSPLQDNLYKTLYRRGEIHRVIAHEHTGLLSSSERTRVENSFMQGSNAWEYNLLSATPTLEMGIDIGSLSSVLLCSVPPAQANYLQRVGRGGRKDGNSFVLTVANGRPHDLVFYADPARMLDTQVEPPAVFLKARHVLRRQLLAYAMDCWAIDHQAENVIPGTMQPVLDAVETENTDKFPYTLLVYLKKNMQEIWDGFSSYVATELADDDREMLRQYLFGGPVFQSDHLQLYVLARLKQVADERKQMTETLANLNKQITNLKKKPQDDHTSQELTELEREVAGYRSMRVRLNKRETLNFFTDEGLLPNYAFPEEGATLHSVIFRSEKGGKEGAEREFIKREYEYQRPAQAALTELAPDSIFYAGNRKVKVERVETAKGRNIQDWRFCPRCHYSAAADDPLKGFSSATCPRCGTAHWGDQSARTKMLKMTQVYAFTNATDAVLDDRSDNREPVFFSKQMLIDFEPSDVSITWVLDDKERPFGFEFIRSCKFLEVNFGRRDGEEMLFDIAGEQLQRSGFQICRECGSVQPKKGDAKHLKSCSFSKGIRKFPDGKDDTGIENCLYLYRQFNSEALRILLPRLATGGTDEQINSFVAALQLGLKRRFGGKVDHLRVAYQSEPNGETDERQHFIVLYDSVPGGTGYLHELLSRSENMQSVFQMAYDVMSACDCYQGAMDGCYRCLLEYRNAYGMESTSKQLALEMLDAIVNGDYEWTESDKSLSALKSNPWLDSELEARFPEAVEKFSGSECVNLQKVRVTQDVIRGKIGHRIIIGNLSYELEPQAEFGKAQGVQFASKPDFVAWPNRQGLRPVAIFLDGYEYHQKIVSSDLIKRQALMHAGFCVWSLNWYDVNKVLGDKAQDVPLMTGMTSPEYHHTAVAALAKKAGVSNIAEHLTKTSFELLMHFLSNQSSEELAKQALFFTLQCIPAPSLMDVSLKQEILNSLKGLPASFTDFQPSSVALTGSAFYKEESGALLRLNMLASSELTTNFDLTEIMVTICYDLAVGNEPKSRFAWQRLWFTLNYLQFLPLVYAYTPQSVHDGTAAGLLWPSVHHQDEQNVGSELPEWFEYLDKELANSMAETKLTWPNDGEVGKEVENSAGEIIGDIEIAFASLRIAFLTNENFILKDILENDGWKVVISLEDLISAITHKNQGV
jgi:DEAD/DEAH box helicase domain-containing protein